jgi:lipid II:glycine glycyltransferase (peptidoglycan interpeptide bridge formation enzyme)
MEIRSRLTGNRLSTLPFSDVCYPLASRDDTAGALVDAALETQGKNRLDFFEMRGAPAVTGTGASERFTEKRNFSVQRHFFNYVISLSEDTKAIKQSFSKKSVRQTINKSTRLGVTVRTGQGEGDLEEFFRLYVLNRKRHGIPPQPKKLFSSILGGMKKDPEALLYLAEYQERGIAALIVFRYKGAALAKYEGVDESYREVLPVYALLWKAIEDACLAGDRVFDFGRTAADNRGLNDFKKRWGTERIELPYYFYPPREGMSVVKSSSLKYRVFTGLVRRLPTSLAVSLGEKIFHHFG